MNAILTVVCTITTPLAMLFGWLYYRQISRAAFQYHVSEARLAELAGELDAKKAYLAGLLNVLYGSAGGIGKRLNESVEIANALRTYGPEVLGKCKGLAFWLHANDQFLFALAGAAGETVLRESPSHARPMLAKDREAIFWPLYDAGRVHKPREAPQVQKSSYTLADANAAVAGSPEALQRWFQTMRTHEKFAAFINRVEFDDRGVVVPVGILRLQDLAAHEVRTMLIESELLVGISEDRRGLILLPALKPFFVDSDNNPSAS